MFVQLLGGFDELPPVVTEGLGYKEMIAAVKGEQSIDDAIAKTVIATRQFAKRQWTWFRADKRIIWREESGQNAVEAWRAWMMNIL